MPANNPAHGAYMMRKGVASLAAPPPRAIAELAQRIRLGFPQLGVSASDIAGVLSAEAQLRAADRLAAIAGNGPAT